MIFLYILQNNWKYINFIFYFLDYIFQKLFFKNNKINNFQTIVQNKKKLFLKQFQK